MSGMTGSTNLLIYILQLLYPLLTVVMVVASWLLVTRFSKPATWMMAIGCSVILLSTIFRLLLPFFTTASTSGFGQLHMMLYAVASTGQLLFTGGFLVFVLNLRPRNA